MRYTNLQPSFWGNLTLITLSLLPLIENHNILFYTLCIIDLLCYTMILVMTIRSHTANKNDDPCSNKKNFIGANDVLCRFTIIGYGILICYLTQNILLEVWYFLLALDVIGVFTNKILPLFENHVKEDR